MTENDPLLVDQPFFPTVHRTGCLFTLALLGWGAVLQTLGHLGIDHAGLLEHGTRAEGHSRIEPGSTRAHRPVYTAALSLGSLTVLALGLTRLLLHLNLIPVSIAISLPALPALLLIFRPSRLAPFSAHFRSAQKRFLAALRRLILPNFHRLPTPFSDIILADILTSLSRPLGELWLAFAQVFHLGNKFSQVSCLLTSLPYLLRFKQCTNDLIIGEDRLKSTLNALKYASAIPAIFLGPYIQHSSVCFNLWLVFSVINSLYSSWWDVVNDWGLRDLTRKSGLLFNNSISYLIIIVLNLTLRMTWTLAILSATRYELAFGLEAAEILRRSVWCLVRIEWAEILRREHSYEELEGELDEEETLEGIDTQDEQLERNGISNVIRDEKNSYHVW